MSAQEEPDKATRNSIFFSIGSFHIAGEPDMMVNKNKKDFSPSVEFGYSYTIFKNASLGLVYSYKKIEDKSYHTTEEEIPYLEKDNALLMAINYRIPIYKFFVMPTLAYGVCHAKIELSEDKDFINPSFRFAKYPGVSMGYACEHWDAFLTYRYECYEFDTYKAMNGYVIATWMFPEVFRHHMFKLGVSYKF
ncbi:MAG: outer membrane beta-barrel protein [Bacteroidales bacterium]|nr:outer membrane beta-barrel protein [Bacteroidales bacterium]MBP5583028.1 outer membrane beta-barrel protein [Bacteroidales bacterium]